MVVALALEQLLVLLRLVRIPCLHTPSEHSRQMSHESRILRGTHYMRHTTVSHKLCASHEQQVTTGTQHGAPTSDVTHCMRHALYEAHTLYESRTTGDEWSRARSTCVRHALSEGRTIETRTPYATQTTHCNTLQHTATYCNTLQHTARTLYATQTNWRRIESSTPYSRQMAHETHTLYESHTLHEACLI